MNMNVRRLEERVFQVLMLLSTVVVVGSLVFILVVIFIKGSQALSLKMLIQTLGADTIWARKVVFSMPSLALSYWGWEPQGWPCW